MGFEAKLNKEEQQVMITGTPACSIILPIIKNGQVRSLQNNSPKGFEHWLIKQDGVNHAQFEESKLMSLLRWFSYIPPA